MDLYINPNATPATMQLKATGNPLSALKFKRGSIVPLTVTILGILSATNLRLGIKSSHEGELLAYASKEAGEVTDSGTTFSIRLNVSSDAIDSALRVGEGTTAAISKLVAMTEFSWQEDGETRISDTVTTTLLNDIIRTAAEPPAAAAVDYPEPGSVATKSWVRDFFATSTGLTAEEITELIDEALISPTFSLTTPEGTEDSHFYYADIPAKYVAAGELHSITLQGPQQILDAYTQPAYLSVWQEHTPSTDDWRPVAVSTNAVKLAANAAHEWLFSDTHLNGNRIRFCLLSTREQGTVMRQDFNIRSRVSVTSKWQDGHIFQPTVANRLPALEVKMKNQGTKFAPASHTVDSIAHLSADEREGLLELLARKDEILTMFPETSTTEEVELPMSMEKYMTSDTEESEPVTHDNNEDEPPASEVPAPVLDVLSALINNEETTTDENA